MSEEYYKILFNADEQACWGDTVYETLSQPVAIVQNAIPQHQYVCINPLNGTRKDANVSKFRNFLLEFDSGSRVEQVRWLEAIPFSTLVWSGGKSYHAIISLEEPYETRAEYDAVMSLILEKVPEADPSARNPSRFTRSPSAIRSNGKVQTLCIVNPRISRLELASWLSVPVDELLVKTPLDFPVTMGSSPLTQVTSPFTKHFLAFGAPSGERNATLFKAAADLTRAGYSPDQIMELVVSVCDLPVWEIKRTISSAAKAARS